MTQALLVIGGLFFLVYVPIAVMAWRRPLLARFAWRESTRRRGQFALLVVGLMVGSASITASLVGSDSSVETAAWILNQRLAAVDLTVTATGGRSFSPDIARQLASDPALTPYIDGVQGGVELPASVADIDQRLGRSGVLLVGFDPSSQRRFGAYLLSDGRRAFGGELAKGDVVLSHDLASALNAKVGDRLRVGTGSGSGGVDLRVYGIAASIGPGAYSSSLAAFMPLETAQLVSGDEGINVVRVAARGGTPADTQAARRAAAPLRSAVSRIPTATPLAVNEVRLDAARQLEDTTAWVLGVNLGFTGLTVLAAIALIVNLVLALAEERRSRLAVLRALGLTRAGLVAISVLEGAIYSLAAATVGVAVGVPAGLYLAGQFWNATAVDPTTQAYFGFQLQIAVRAATLALAFAIGALITLGTVAAAAYRTSRIAIAPAIRDLPEPASPARHRWQLIVLLVVMAAFGTALLVPNDARTRLVGGVALIVTAAALARGRLPDRARATLTGVLLAVWAGLMAATVSNTSDLSQLLVLIFGGVTVAAVGLSIAAAANLSLIEAGIGVAGHRSGLLLAMLRPPIAYLSRRPIRTGLATSAFALVLVLVTLIAVASAAQSRDYARDSAGFDIEVVTSGAGAIQLPHEVEHNVIAQMAIPMRVYQGPLSAPSGYSGEGISVPVIFYVLPEAPADGAPVYLNARMKGFSSNSEVWQALRSDPHLAVAMAGTGIMPGDQVSLQGANGPVRLRVAGSEGSTVLQGIIASSAAVAQIDTRPAGTTLLVKARPGSDPRELARQVERSLFDQGVQATSIRDILDQDYASNVGYTTEYDVLLHMGLLVGVLALAMIGIRAAIERRRVIGILRALGYQPPRLLAGLVAEAALTATVGVATGIGAGLLVGYLAIAVVGPGSTFGVNISRLVFALVIVYGTVLIVTGPLASRAARMAPTEAIRFTG